MPKYLTEFIGTFLFVFTIGLVVTGGGAPTSVIAIGIMLAAMIYMGGHVSGAHYNPAVSLALAIAGKFKWADLVPYWLAQLLGAAGGVTVAQLCAGQSPSIAPARGLATHIPLIIEVLFTMALCLVVLNIATHKKTQGNYAYGVAIGFTIVGAAYTGGGISGGAFNPAVGTGLSLFMEDKSNLWIYWVGPMIGAVISAFLFKLQESEPASA